MEIFANMQLGDFPLIVDIMTCFRDFGIFGIFKFFKKFAQGKKFSKYIFSIDWQHSTVPKKFPMFF